MSNEKRPMEDATAGGAVELLRLAWPLVLSNSFWTLQIVLDRILISRSLGEGVGAAFSAAMLFWVPMALLQNTASYATTFVAQYTGANQPHRVGPAVWQSLYFSITTGVAFLGLVPLTESLIALGAHDPELQAMEAIYFRCLCFAALPILVTHSVSSFFAGRGDSRTVLVINAVGLTVNAFFTCAWIFGLWGFPQLGIAGAGWATVLGSSTSALVGLGWMLRPCFQKAFATAAWRFEKDLFRRLMRFGIPNGLFAGLDVLAFTIFLFIVGRLGKVELAASSIAFTLNLFSFLPSFGLGQAVAVLVGQRLGENRPDLAERTTWAGLCIALVYMLVIGLIYLLLPDQLAMIFQSDSDAAQWQQVAALIPTLLAFVALYSSFDAMNLVFSFALRGAGDTRFVTLIAFFLSWPIMVLPTWAAWRFDWGLYWAWTFASVYILLLALVFLLRFRQGRWRTMRVIEMAAASGTNLKLEPDELEDAESLDPITDSATSVPN
ncbi:MAG TPA: MATE family efflux transporter [Gemmataceae bacterium]|nr:MATE family efflux transporter [Gemmataceae bacterium]